MIKVKRSIVIDSLKSFEELTTFPVNSSLRLKLKNVWLKLKPIIETFQETWNAKIEELGKSDENGEKKILPNTPDLSLFSKEMDMLRNEEIEIDIQPFSRNEIKRSTGEDIDMPTRIEISLNWLIVE